MGIEGMVITRCLALLVTVVLLLLDSLATWSASITLMQRSHAAFEPSLRDWFHFLVPT